MPSEVSEVGGGSFDLIVENYAWKFVYTCLFIIIFFGFFIGKIELSLISTYIVIYEETKLAPPSIQNRLKYLFHTYIGV